MSICPRCFSNLRPVTPWNVPAEECGKCHGLWFDPANVEVYARAADQRPPSAHTRSHDFVPEHTSRRLRCPACDALTLEPGFARGLSLHRCARCRGVFIGAGELRALRERGPEALEEPEEPSVFDTIDETVGAVRVAIDIVRLLVRLIR